MQAGSADWKSPELKHIITISEKYRAKKQRHAKGRHVVRLMFLGRMSDEDVSP